MITEVHHWKESNIKKKIVSEKAIMLDKVSRAERAR